MAEHHNTAAPLPGDALRPLEVKILNALETGVGFSPSVLSTGAGAGVGGSITIDSTVTTEPPAIVARVVSSGSPSANSEIGQISFGKTYANPPIVTVSVVTASTDTNVLPPSTQVHSPVDKVTTTQFSLWSGNSALATGVTFRFAVTVLGS